MRKIICIILFFTANCLLPVFSFSQTWPWAKSAGGSFNPNDGQSVATDAAGNVYVTGYFYSPAVTFGSFTLTNTDPSGNTEDIFLAKYDASGNVLWVKSAGGINHDAGFSVATDVSGNVYVTGYFDSPTATFGTYSLTLSPPGTGGNVFLAKYDASGNVLWAQQSTGGAGGLDKGYGLTTDTTGNVYITGRFSSSSINFGSYTLTNANVAFADIFLAKYDAAGNVLWAKSGGGATDDAGYSISTDAAGNIYVTGNFFSPTATFGSTILTNADNSGSTDDVFIVKYDGNGNMLWAKSAGGLSGDDKGFSITTDASGNSYITGSFGSPAITFGSNTLNNAGVINFFLVKYDASGTMLWAKSGGGSDADFGYSVTTNASGNVLYVIGYMSRFSPFSIFGSYTLTAPANSTDPLFILKYDPQNGNELCASVLASGGVSQSGVATDACGNDAYIASHFQVSPFTVGTTTLTLTGTQDVFVAKYTCGCNLMATIVGDTALCSGISAVLTATAIAPAACSTGYSWNWSTGDTTSSITVSPSITTTYSVIVSNGLCSDTVAATVVVFPNPVAVAASNVTIVQGQSTTLNASGGTTYSWSNGSTDSVITVIPLVTTLYCVTASNVNSCKDTACVQVTVKEIPCEEIFIPNAFSPNNDAENDLECVLGSNCIKSLRLSIYNRWGEKVFETDNPNICWDGTYKGKPANTAVFIYYLEATLTSGEKINRKGNINLIR